MSEVRIVLNDEMFETMMNELRRGNNEFIFTNETGRFAERFCLERDGRTKKVRCVELDRIFDSVSEASKAIGCQRPNLSTAIAKGKRCGGYTFHYYYDVMSLKDWLDYLREKESGRIG